MPFSYQQHTANGSTSVFSAAQIDGYLSVSHLNVYVNDVLKTLGVHYTLQTSPTLQVTFDPAHIPTNGQAVRIQRITPSTVAGREVDFEDGSVLTASDLDRSALQLLYIAQESEDLGSGALGKQFDQLGWDAGNLPVNNAAAGASASSLATKGYVDTLALYGGATSVPQAWVFSGNGVQDGFTLSPAANASDPNSFIVEVDGELMNPGTDYTVPSSTLLQFAAGAVPGAGTGNIKVRNLGVSRSLNDSVSTAMIQANAVTEPKLSTALIAKINQLVHPTDFGAIGDGVADDTAALKAAFDYAMPLKKAVVLEGSYKVSGPVTSLVTTVGTELHIVCNGDVVITVDPAATAVFALFYLLNMTGSAPNVSVTGGSLSIDCSDKIANCFWLQKTIQGGTATFQCPVSVRNCKQLASSINASGLTLSGIWNRVFVDGFTAINVTSTTASGVTRGISADIGATGEGFISNCHFENILLLSPADTNADGIGVSGQSAAGDAFNDNRLGKFVIKDCTFIDCQGRAVKSQCSDTTIINPYVKRQNYVSFTGGDEFAFQFAGGRLLSPTFEYRLNGSTSPLGTGYMLATFAFRTPQFGTTNEIRNAVVRSEVPIRRLCGLFPETTQKSASVIIDGVSLEPLNGYSGAIIDREIVLISNTERLVSMPETLGISVKNVRGPMNASAVGYSAYLGGSIASKLAIDIDNVYNTLPQGTFTDAIYQLDNQKILGLDKLSIGTLGNIRQTFASVGQGMRNFDFANLEAGTKLTLATEYLGTITNAPPWQAGAGSVLVEVLANGTSAVGIEKFIRVTTFSGNSRERGKVFVSYDNATTWREEDACAPVTKTADFTLANTEDVVIVNKSGSACVVTLPDASVHVGRRILIKTIQNQPVNSASSNVVPLAGGAAGTAILTNTAGRWTELVSDGTNWIEMAGN